jgi:WD40 repeat protein
VRAVLTYRVPLFVALSALLLAGGCWQRPAPVVPDQPDGGDVGLPRGNDVVLVADGPDDWIAGEAIAAPPSREPVADVNAGQSVRGVLHATLGLKDPAAHDFVITPDGRSMITTGDPGRASFTVWDLASGKVVREIPARGVDPQSIHVWAVSPDGKTLVASAPNDGVALWDLASGAMRRRLEIDRFVKRAAFALNGKLLFVQNSNGVTRHGLDGSRRAASERRLLQDEGLAVTADGKTVAVPGDKGSISLLDGKTLRLLRTIPGHKGIVNGLAFSPDGKTLASVCSKGQILLHDLAGQGDPREVKPAVPDNHYTVAFSPSGRLLAVGGSGVTLHDVATGKVQVRFHDVAYLTGHVAFSSDGSTLAANSTAFPGVWFWRLSGGAESKSLPRADLAWAAAVAPKGVRAAIRDGKGLHLVRLADGVPERTLHVKQNHRPAAAFSRDGSVLAYSPDEERVVLVETADGKQRATLDTKELGEVKSMTFSPDGGQLALTNGDRVQRWDLGQAPSSRPDDHKGRSVASMAFSPDGKRLALGVKSALRVRDLGKGEPAWAVLAHEGYVEWASFSGDGRRLLTCASHSLDRAARLWDADGKLLLTLRHAARPTIAFLTPDDALAITITEDGVIRAHDAATGKWVGKRPGPAVSDPPVIAPDRSAVLVAGHKAFHLIDVGTLKPGSFDGRPDAEPSPAQPTPSFVPDRLTITADARIVKAAFSADSKRLVALSDDKEVFVWDAVSGKLTRSFASGIADPLCLALSADGKRLAVGARDTIIYLFDLDAGRLEKTLRGHKSFVRAVALSPDGKRLASAIGGTVPTEVLLWDVAAGKSERTVLGGGGPIVDHLAFTSGGDLLVGAGAVRRFAPSGAERPALPHPNSLTFVAASPDGKWIAASDTVARSKGDVTVWDADGKSRHKLPCPDDRLTMLAFGDGDVLAVSTWSVTFWDARAGKKLGQIPGTLLALSPDGKTAVTTDSIQRKGVRLRDVTALRDDALQKALAPAMALTSDGEVSRGADGVRVELTVRGPDSIAALAALAEMPGPFALELGDADLITADVIRALSGLKRLQRLKVRGAGWSDEHLATMAALPMLEGLDLSGCERLTPEGLRTVTGVKRLKELKLPTPR